MSLVFGGAGAEPAVALKAEAGAEGAGLVLDAALDEKVIAENLGDGTVFLEHLTSFSGILRETVEEIEGRSVWIHRVWSGKNYPENSVPSNLPSTRIAGARG